jgi:hypothetical protein
MERPELAIHLLLLKQVSLFTPLETSTFEFSGNVAPVADIEIVPVPSDDIVEPPN